MTNADWLAGGGEMGKLVSSKDWSKTPLGPTASWPQSLRTTVSLCLASNFPISIVWGPDHVQIYNDGYWPICGAKHPHSMGQDFSQCWASAWPVIGAAFERALAGKTSFLEDQRMFLDRNGYLEETFFTFSFSPIRDESGGVGGLFHPVTETTGKMLAERRTRALRDLAARAGEAQTIDDAFTLAARTLGAYELDIPFALFYALDGRGKEARLAARTGLSSGSDASPAAVDLEKAADRGWPLAVAARTRQVQRIDDLKGQFGSFSCGPYPEPPKAALVLPLVAPGRERPAGLLVAGLSSRLPFDDGYRSFIELVAAGVAAGVANAGAYEEERRRAEALAEIDRAKTAFFSNVSHEFRTPLTLMLGPLEDELAERANPLPAARRERLETAHRNSLRLLKLVNSLLDFSRIEAGRVQACYEPVDLAAYTAELSSVFRSAIEKAGLTLAVDCPAMPESVYVDREMWEKIVLNLLSNALKHTFNGGISVALRRRGDSAELVVTDTGVGIAPTEQARLFERFYRVKGTKSRTHEGTGIGLALVKELAALHGGTIGVESREGLGSVFTVSVRAGRDHLPPDLVVGSGASAAREPRSSAFTEEALHWLPGASAPIAVQGETEAFSRPLVLLADDNSDMRDYVRGLLSDRYEVLAVADGAAALAAARERPPDLVVSDVMMPLLDGFALLKELRADARTQAVPVILLSARAGEEAAVEGLDTGADDYIVKPFSARELLARVRTHLELARVRRAWSEELRAANKELEAFSYSVSHDLRAPLRAINGYSRMILEDYGEELDEEGRSLLDASIGSARKMGALIDDLLEFARAGRGALRLSAFEPAVIAKEVLDELVETCPDRKIEVSIGPMPAAWGDPALLRQVFVNLLSNAVKYTRSRDVARIELGGSAGQTEHTYWVKDNGAGFDMKYAQKLFGVFQRMHGGEFEGTGVGLALVQRLVNRHSGRIWAEAVVDKGASFYFTLPRSKSQKEVPLTAGLFVD